MGARPVSGQNVVSLDCDFPTVTYPWIRIATETGVEVRLVSPRALVSAVDERTAVISVSHVQYATGHRFDLEELAELAHAHDALLAVDVAQSAGVS